MGKHRETQGNLGQQQGKQLGSTVQECHVRGRTGGVGPGRIWPKLGKDMGKPGERPGAIPGESKGEKGEGKRGKHWEESSGTIGTTWWPIGDNTRESQGKEQGKASLTGKWHRVPPGNTKQGKRPTGENRGKKQKKKTKTPNRNIQGKAGEHCGNQWKHPHRESPGKARESYYLNIRKQTKQKRGGASNQDKGGDSQRNSREKQGRTPGETGQGHKENPGKTGDSLWETQGRNRDN